MKRRILSFGLALTLLLSGCAAGPGGQEEADLTIVATTYPVYLFASSVTKDVEGVQVERLNTGETSCLHDYTLSVNDMKLLERADVIAMNGAGLEEFLEDALASSDAVVIDCSEGVELLENLSHHHDEHDHSHDGHDHGHWDPHYWMDPRNASVMVQNLTNGIVALDPEHEAQYRERASMERYICAELDTILREELLQPSLDAGMETPKLITFHDGFQYFAHAYGMELLEAIEEEAGSEASAKEIVEITKLVKEHDIPVIFTEVNGSDATAKAISRETGCQVAQLTMIMDEDEGFSDYALGMMKNMRAVINAFSGEENAQ